MEVGLKGWESVEIVAKWRKDYGDEIEDSKQQKRIE
jgi:hypothetical protein